MKMPLRRKLDDVCHHCGVNEELVIRYIEEEWIHPLDYEHRIFDDEDMARIHLISDLKNNLGVNDEAIPIILSLIDQLNLLHLRIKGL